MQFLCVKLIHSVGLTIIFSDPPLQASDVFSFLCPKVDEWNKIGREFGISIGERNCLKKDASLSEEDRLENVIQLWIDKAESRTWDELKECLKRLKFIQILGNVQDFLEAKIVTPGR